MGDADLLVPASMLKHAETWAIVRRLAESDPYDYDEAGTSCHFCGVGFVYFSDLEAVTGHGPDCEWRNAREVLDDVE